MDFEVGVREVCGPLAFGDELRVHIISGMGIVDTDAKIANIADIRHRRLKGVDRMRSRPFRVDLYVKPSCFGANISVAVLSDSDQIHVSFEHIYFFFFGTRTVAWASLTFNKFTDSP